MFERPDIVHEPLYVITPVFNPERYRQRWKLYQDFAHRVVQAGAVLYTVEATFGNREFSLADIAPHGRGQKAHPHVIDKLKTGCRHESDYRGLHQYIQVRTSSEI